MSLESPDNEKNFPGLYKQGSVSEPNTEDDALGKKRDSSRKRDGKKEKKEKGYQVFEEEESEEELTLPEDIKSPTKSKKLKPGFKLPTKKDIFPRMKEKDKDEKREKEGKKEDKEKKKEEKDGKKDDKEKKKDEKDGKKVKIKEKEKKKSKHGLMDLKTVPPTITTCDSPIFAVPLATAVQRNPSHDGIELPAIVRECIDYVEECGLTCEGIYRISGVKSKVQQLKEAYNKGLPVDLVEHEPNIVASLLKQFLRELPESVLTAAMMPKFEEASTIKNEKKKIEMFIRLIEDLPACNRLLLSWMIVHMTHIIELQKENKMTLQNVSIVLSPTMQISHRVLNSLFTLAHQIFKDTYLKKYVPPLKPATSRWSLELPDNTGALEEELAKQESLLNQLHARINAGRGDPQAEEQLWEVQRVVTQLKRKIKLAKKAHTQGATDRRRKDIDLKRSSQLSDTDELNLDLRAAPAPASETAAAAVEVHSEETQQRKEQASVKNKQEPVSVAGSETRKDEDKLDMKKEQLEAPQEGTEKPKPPEVFPVQATADAEVASVATESASESVSTQAEAQKQPAETAKTVPESEIDEASQMAEESLEKEAMENEETETDQLEPDSAIAGSDTKELENKVEVKPETEHPEPEMAQSRLEPVQPELESALQSTAMPEKESTLGVLQDSKAEGEGKGGKPVLAGEDTLKVSLKGAGEEGKAEDVEKAKSAENIPKAVVPPAALEEKEAKPRGPVQVHPHLYLSLEPLQPIKAQPLKPRRERPDKSEESFRRSQKLRELEEELLGLGSTVKDKAVEDKQAVEETELGGEEEPEYDAADEEELQRLVEEEFLLRLEEEELLAIGDELRKKIETEESETERLQLEIQELQYLRHDSDVEEVSSNSDSSYESEDEEEMNTMLSSLIQENLQLERENAEMCQKIHEERMICLSVKLQIRLLQQKQLESSQNSLLGDF